MDKIELSLNQVNFEEQTLAGSSVEDLHSFSNVVSYDTDFEQISGGAPVTGRKLAAYEEPTSPVLDGLSAGFQFSHAEEELRLYSLSKRSLGFNSDIRSDLNRSRRESGAMDAIHPSLPDNSRHGDSGHQFSSKPADTFTAFTETVEALALQKSVIGNPSITPASADEVARVIAETQARILQQSSAQANNGRSSNSTDSIHDRMSRDSATHSTENSLLETMRHNQSVVHSTPVNNGGSMLLSKGSDFEIEDGNLGSLSIAGKELVRMRPDDISRDGKKLSVSSLTKDSGFESGEKSQTNPSQRKTRTTSNSSVESISSTKSKQSVSNTSTRSEGLEDEILSDSGNLGSLSIAGKELIRVRADGISRDAKKSSGWFWGKSDAPDTNASKQKSKTKVNESPEADAGKQNTKSKINGAGGKTTKKDSNEQVLSGDEKSQNSEASERSICELDISIKSNDSNNSMQPFRSDSSLSNEYVDGVTHGIILNSDPARVVESTSSSTSSVEVKPGEVKSTATSSKANTVAETSTTVTERKNSSSKTISNVNSAGENITVNATESKSFHGTNMNVKIDRNLEEVKRIVVSREEVSIRSAPQTPQKRGAEGQQEVGQLLKEKAKLEGHIEVLEAENREMLKERAELLSKVAGLSQELSSNKSSSQNLVGDRDALTADLETLRQNRARLEAVIMDAHKLLEEKDQDLQTLQRDLSAARAVGDKYLEKLGEVKQELKSREATADDLKTKITELYIEFQTTNQNRILAVNEYESLQGEMKALAATKDWYKEQLQAFQREKIELQSEVTRVKTEMISQGTTIEHLRAENSRVKRYVGEMEQKSLSEKQGLARHLEMIESDMMEREAAFSQLKRERQFVEVTQNSADEDEKRILMEDLESAQSDARRAHSQLAVLQSEHTELSKRLALSQESILERDRMIESLEKSREDVESRLAKSQLEISGRDELMERIRHEKSTLEVELAAATEEKRVFDTSLKSLKDDMSKVEASFRSMKNELLAKQGVISELQEELQKVRTGSISESVDGSTRLIEIANVHSFAPPRHIMQALTKYEVGETQTDTALVESAQLQEKISEMEALQRQADAVNGELTTVKKQLMSALSEKRDVEDSKVAADRELILTKERLLDVEMRLQQAVEERGNLERAVLEQRERSAAEVKESLQLLQAAPKVDPETQERLSALQAENLELLTRIEDVKREAERDLNEQKYEVAKLMEQTETLEKSHRDTLSGMETQNNELTLQVAALQESKRRLETDLEDVRNRASMDLDAVTSQLQSNLESARNEIETLNESRREIELRLETIVNQKKIEIEEFIHRTTVLETELHTARTYIDEKQAVYEDTQSLAIELEREKGRLAGILQSHSALKEHASTLEQSLASKESSVVQLSSHVSDEIERKEREMSEMREQVKELEESLVKERQTAKDARKQLLTEKGSHVKARRELEQQTAEHQQLVKEVEQLKKTLTKITEEHEADQASEVSRKLENERIVGELKTVTLDRDRLMRESFEMEAKEATMKEQIQSLEWKYSEKETELKAANDRIQLIEERQRYDMANLSQTLQSTTTELVSLRREMSSVTQERSELKAQIVRLKEALRMIIEQQQKKGGKTEIVIDYEELNRLLADSEPPPVESRPLSFLQATLTGLRGEISSLQLQVNEHTTAVQSSSQAWKELEAQVLDLREVCQSSAAGRAASQTIIQPDLDLASILQQAPPSLRDLTNQTSQDIFSTNQTSRDISTSVMQAADGAEISMTTVKTSESSKKKTVTKAKAS